MATEYNASKEGYIQSYRIEATLTPNADTYYFEVTITDDKDGNKNQETWGLPRNQYSEPIDVVNVPGPMGTVQRRYAISYANTHQAIIATLKDALLNTRKVQLEGVGLPLQLVIPEHELPTPVPGEGRSPNSIPGGSPYPIEPDEDQEVVSRPEVRRDDRPTNEIRQVTIYK